ncbi:MAG: ATP-binding protein [Spirochaetia bacterium]
MALPAGVARLGRMLEVHGGILVAASGPEVRSVFPTAAAAVTAAMKIQLTPTAGGSRVSHTAKSRASARCALGPRIAIHAGEVERAGEGDAATAADRTALLLRASHRGQILVSGTAVERARDRLPGGAAVRSLGMHQLEDLGPPVSVYQLVHPALPSRFPPLRTLECRPGNLRGQPTSLVGRERELGLLCDLAKREEVRVLTLSGPGGAGKTRLALHAAARLSAGFPHGVFVVDLSPLHMADQLLPAIVATLGIREPPGEPRPLFAVLTEYLRKKQALLVLDNFEHLLSAAHLVGEIASACPGVKVLATSREALHLRGEHEFPVPPLGLPSDGAARKDIARCEAVRLFAERARAAWPDFVVTEENAPVLAEICARLDGLPLAIELIAARIRVVPPATMRERLFRRQLVLTRGADDLPPRQRTLRSEIAWSYNLLGEQEKRLFRRLAIFAGGCFPVAAESVCAEKTPDDAHATLDGLGALVDKSLLQRQSQADGTDRFRMLETIRDFAMEQLEASGELPVTLQRFSRAALRAAEEAATNLHGPHQARWFDHLDSEQDNMKAALAWLSETRNATEGIRMAASLGWYWFRRGRFSVGEQWLRRFLSMADGSEPPAARAEALYHLGWIRLMLGCMFYGNGEARACFRESLALWQRVRHERGEALCLAWLSWCEVDLPMHERCAMADRSVAVARGTGDPWALSFCLKLAHSFLPREDEDGTDKTAALEEAIGLARQTGDPFLICQALHGMGDVHQFLRQDAAAEKWYLESLDLAKQIGDTWSIFDTQSHLAWGYANRGELARAGEIFADALRMTAELGARAYIGQYLAGLACIAKREGRGVRALRLDGAVSAIRRAELPGWDLRLAEGTGLTPGAGEKEWNAGRSMTTEQVVEYALDDVD